MLHTIMVFLAIRWFGKVRAVTDMLPLETFGQLALTHPASQLCASVADCQLLRNIWAMLNKLDRSFFMEYFLANGMTSRPVV